MTRTVDGAIAWARQHPTKDVGETDWTWAGWCAALMFWACGFARSFSYALDAAHASGPLNPDWRAAPRGALHYWGGVWIGGRENGHVALDIGDGHRLLMASSRVDTGDPLSDFGNAIGTIRFADYGLPNYLGWSLNWGTERLADAGTAGLGYDPIGDDMFTDADRAKLDNIAAHLYAGGPDAARPDYLGGPGSVYALLKTPVLRTVDGKPARIAQIQDNADTNTMVRRLLELVGELVTTPAGEPAPGDELDAGELAQQLLEQLPGAVVDELVARAGRPAA